jgi:hypothetical protein
VQVASEASQAGGDDQLRGAATEGVCRATWCQHLAACTDAGMCQLLTGMWRCQSFHVYLLDTEQGCWHPLYTLGVRYVANPNSQASGVCSLTTRLKLLRRLSRLKRAQLLAVPGVSGRRCCMVCRIDSILSAADSTARPDGGGQCPPTPYLHHSCPAGPDAAGGAAG